MAKKKVKKKAESLKRELDKKDDKKLFAFLASFLTIVGFIIALVLKREDKYIMFYAKQGLILFVGQVIIGVISKIPIIGWFILGPILLILWIILWIITWINALSGNEKKTWLIGDLAEKIKL